MEVQFILNKKDLKNIHLSIYDKSYYYKKYKLILSIVITIGVFVIFFPILDILSILSLFILFEISPLRYIVFALIIIGVLFSGLYFFLLDFLVKNLIKVSYSLNNYKETKEVTVRVEENCFNYTTSTNEYEVPWRKVDVGINHKDFYIFYVEALSKFLVIKKKPESLNEKEQEQFNSIINSILMEKSITLQKP